MEDAVAKAALGGDEISVPVGVVEESGEDEPEGILRHPHPKVAESRQEVRFEIVGDPGGYVGSHDSVDRVEQQRRGFAPMSIDGGASDARVFGDAHRSDGIGTLPDE